MFLVNQNKKKREILSSIINELMYITQLKSSTSTCTTPQLTNNLNFYDEERKKGTAYLALQIRWILDFM